MDKFALQRPRGLIKEAVALRLSRHVQAALKLGLLNIVLVEGPDVVKL